MGTPFGYITKVISLTFSIWPLANPSSLVFPQRLANTRYAPCHLEREKGENRGMEEWSNRGIEEMGERSEGRGETSADPNTERESEYPAEYKY